MVIYDYI
jgi:hypothetical protein